MSHALEICFVAEIFQELQLSNATLKNKETTLDNIFILVRHYELFLQTIWL